MRRKSVPSRQACSEHHECCCRVVAVHWLCRQMEVVQDAIPMWPFCLPARMTAFGFAFGFQGSKEPVSTSKETGLEVPIMGVLIVGVTVDCNGTMNK